MAEPITFDELPNVGDLSQSAIIALIQQTGGTYESFNASLAQVAELVSKGISYEELPTEAKDILGAITEIYNSGGGGGGSNVKMKDNPNGGVDLTVDGLLRTLALQGSGGGGTPEIYTAKLQGEGSSPWSTNSTTNKTLLDFGTIHLSKGVYVCMSNSTAWNFSTTNQGFAISVKWGDNVQTIHDNGEISTITLNGAFEVAEEGDYEVSFVGRVGGSEKTASLKPWSIMWGYIVGVGGSGGGSSVTMSDNSTGGVDITVEDNTKTLATQKDLDTLYKITQGQSWDFVDQQESGMNIAPKGTERQSLFDVRGHSIQGENPTPDNPQPITSVEELNFKVTGKNLFNKGAITDGRKVAVSNGSTLGDGNFFITDYIPVKAEKTYHFENLMTFGSSYYGFAYYDINKTFVTGVTYNSIEVQDKKSFNITVPSDPRIVYAVFTGDKASSVIDSIQIELGTTPTEYSPYREPTTHTIIPPFALNKIGDYADFASIEAGEWVKNIYSRTVNENDVYAYSTGRNAVILKYTDYLAKKVISGEEQSELIIKSDHFTGVSWFYYGNHSDDGLITVQYSVTGEKESFIQLRDLSLTTVDMWKSWLTSNNTLIMYVLMNSISQPIETTDLEYLKSLQNLDSDNVITITDQNGNDISYLMKYLIKLSEAI